MHISASSFPAVADIQANIQRLADLGLQVNISEMDVRVKDVAGDAATKLARQRQVYRDVVAACVAVPRCEAVTLWGFTDAHSWIDSTFGADDPLVFDEQYRAKPAFFGVEDAFFSAEGQEGGCSRRRPDARRHRREPPGFQRVARRHCARGTWRGTRAGRDTLARPIAPMSSSAPRCLPRALLLGLAAALLIALAWRFWPAPAPAGSRPRERRARDDRHDARGPRRLPRSPPGSRRWRTGGSGSRTRARTCPSRCPRTPPS